MLLEKQMSYIFSSDLANGAKNKSSDGASFFVQLDTPISIPPRAKFATLETTHAQIWNVVPNISATLGNNMFRYEIGGVPESFVIPDGLYSRSALNTLLSRELVSAGYGADDIVLSEDAATQKVVVIFKNAGDQLDFTLTDTPYVILGFTNRLVPLVPSTPGQTVYGDSTAQFNTIDSFLIHCGIVSQGIPVNSQAAQIIANVPINDVKIGSKINFEPFAPTRTPVNELIGQRLNYFRCWLTDETNADVVDTLGENWQFTIIIRYWLEV